MNRLTQDIQDMITPLLLIDPTNAGMPSGQAITIPLVQCWSIPLCLNTLAGANSGKNSGPVDNLDPGQFFQTVFLRA